MTISKQKSYININGCVLLIGDNYKQLYRRIFIRKKNVEGKENSVIKIRDLKTRNNP